MTPQKQLSALGYSTSGAYGLWGANTCIAVARWPTANRPTASGFVSQQEVRQIAEQAGPADTAPGNSAAGDNGIEERVLGLTREERGEVQQRLTRIGYSTGGVDGSPPRGGPGVARRMPLT